MEQTNVIISLAALLLCFVGVHGAQVNVEPCDPGKYREIDDPFRSTGFETRPPHVPLCDERLRRGWYRFTSPAGGEMPTTCQPTNSCGTTAPIWLKGQHPSPSDGIVIRPICANLNQSSGDPLAEACCEYTEEIFMKNCGTFYVYYLYPTIDCDMAYCAGNVAPCPVGKWSATNFPPCKDSHPVLEKPPVLTGPNTDKDNSVYFQCEVPYGPDDPDQVFEVIFTVNQRPIPGVPTKRLEGGNKTARLDSAELVNYVGTNVGCEVVSYYVGRETDKSDSIKSITVYFGLKSPPVLAGPIIANDSHSFSFECRLNASVYGPDQMFEIGWTFDNQMDPSISPMVVSGRDPVAILDGRELEGHMGSQVGCQVRLFMGDTNITTAWLASKTTYFAGIQISPKPLVISEAHWSSKVTVVSTVPLICDQEPVCCLTFRLNVNESSAVTLLNTCEYKLCSTDWDAQLSQASTQITVVPNRNMIRGGDRGVYLKFHELSPASSSPYLQAFHGYELEQLSVVVKDEASFTCSLTGDPHIKGFDFSDYHHLFVAGDFIAYQVKSRDFMVQIRTWPCGSGAVACICGLVIKERNDVIKYYGCDPSARTATLNIAYPLSQGTVIQRSSNGAKLGVRLSSGSEVNVNYRVSSMDVYISTPPFDFNQTSGLCGVNDGVPDGFTFPNGSVYNLCARSSRCIPNVFYGAWSVEGNSSLFIAVPNPRPVTDGDSYGTGATYCSCTEDTTGNSTVTCSPITHVHSTNTACPRCGDITNTLVPSYVQGEGWIAPSTGKPEPPYTHVSIPPVDPNKGWPNAQGVTEAEARAMCTQAIQKSQLHAACQGQQGSQVAEEAMKNCLSDILFGNTREYLDAITSAFTTECQTDLSRDPKNYVTDGNGGQVLKPDILYVCPLECEKHGQCGNRDTCVCDPGWEGETCHLEVGKGPQMGSVTGGPLCDVKEKSCKNVYIEVSNINLAGRPRCKIQEIDFWGNKIGGPVTFPAVSASPTQIVCPLPERKRSSHFYLVSATTDGSLYGNSIKFHVFDSTCLDCNDVGCAVKFTACHIQGVCYEDGYFDPSDEKRRCDISKNFFYWTYTYTPCEDTNTTPLYRRPQVDEQTKQFLLASLAVDDPTR